MEIVKYEASGTEIEISADDVRKLFCRNATDKEIGLFLELCRAQKLNPFIKEAYLVKYGDSPAQIITGKDVFTKRAYQHPKFRGMEAGVTVCTSSGKIERRKGSMIVADLGETLLGGWCSVYIDGYAVPMFDEVSLSEYSTGKSMWKAKPATMIRKVAIVHALREAFPESFQGLYAAEEMGVGDKPEELPQEVRGMALESIVVPQSKVSAVPMITDSQAECIDELADEFAKLRGKAQHEVMDAAFKSRTMSNMGVEPESGLSDLTEEQAAIMIELLRAWGEKAREQDEMAEEDIAF